MTKDKSVILTGIQGNNPLGFLAGLGTLVTATNFCTDARLSWRVHEGFWRPVLHGVTSEPDPLIQLLHDTLKKLPREPFTHERQLPFNNARFVEILRQTQPKITMANRRVADFLAFWGTEVYVKDKGNFQNSSFVMNRSSDSGGNGFPVYAEKLRDAVTTDHIRETLFDNWQYVKTGKNLSNFRWDPIEDQRWALRWGDPSPDKDKASPGTMVGAYTLALESMVLFPTVPGPKSALTAGFSRTPDKQVAFTWPIWEAPVSMDVIRSLVTLEQLHEPHPDVDRLADQGIVETFRCLQIASNKYYRNFTMAEPI